MASRQRLKVPGWAVRDSRRLPAAHRAPAGGVGSDLARAGAGIGRQRVLALPLAGGRQARRGASARDAEFAADRGLLDCLLERTWQDEPDGRQALMFDGDVWTRLAGGQEMDARRIGGGSR